MRKIFITTALSIASVALSAAVAAPASATQETTADWAFFDSYATSKICNNRGALGILGGAWTSYACSYVPVDDQPYWLYVYYA